MNPSDKDALELGRAVHQATATLLQHPEVAFSASPVDVMHPDGMRRAFVMVTLDPAVVQFLEQGLRIAMDQARRAQDGHDGD